MANIFKALFAKSATPSDDLQVAGSASTRALHTKNSRADTNKLANTKAKLDSGRETSKKEVSRQDNKTSGGISMLRSIRAFFSGNSSARKKFTNTPNAMAPAQIETKVEVKIKVQPLKRLGNLPFKTWNVQLRANFAMSDEDREAVRNQLKKSENSLENLLKVDNQLYDRRAPEICLAAVLYASGMYDQPAGFPYEFDMAGSWSTHNDARYAWNSVLSHADNVVGAASQEILNADTIQIRIELCRMAAQRVSPEFLKKFDEVATTSQTAGGSISHGITTENYWEIITGVQMLAWGTLVERAPGNQRIETAGTSSS